MVKLKNGKAASGDEITEEMKKGGGDKVLDCIWRLCNYRGISLVWLEKYMQGS